ETAGAGRRLWTDLSSARKTRWSGPPTGCRGAGKPCEKSPAGECVRRCVIPRDTTDGCFPDGGLRFPSAVSSSLIVMQHSELFRGGGVETAANSLVEIGPWTRKDSAHLKWLSIADLGGCGRLCAVFGGTGGIASRTCPRGHPEATLRPCGSQPVGTQKPP